MSVNIRNPITGELTNASGGVINPKSINEMIAPIEDGTASKAYVVGEQFIMNDLLCEATQAIAQGDTMVIGTNCEESEQLSKQVKDIKSDLTDCVESGIFTVANKNLTVTFLKQNPKAISFSTNGISGKDHLACVGSVFFENGAISQYHIASFGKVGDNFTIFEQSGLTWSNNRLDIPLGTGMYNGNKVLIHIRY